MAPIDLVDEKKTTSQTTNTTDCSNNTLPPPSSIDSSSSTATSQHTLLQILVNNKVSSTNDHMDQMSEPVVNTNLGNKSIVVDKTSGESKTVLQRHVRSSGHNVHDNNSGGEEDDQFKNDNTSQEDDEEEEVDENVSTASSSYSTSSLSPMSDVTSSSSPPDTTQQNGTHSTVTRLKAVNSVNNSCSKNKLVVSNESNEIAEEESSPTPTLTPNDKNIQSSSSNFTDDEKQHRFIEFYPSSSNTTNLTDSQLAAATASCGNNHSQVLLQPPSSLPIRPNVVCDSETVMSGESSNHIVSSSSIYVPATQQPQTQAIYSPNGLVTYHTSPPPIIYHHPMANGIYTNGYTTPATAMQLPTASNQQPYSIISPASQPSELGAPILSLSPQNPTPDSGSLATSPISLPTSNMPSSSPSDVIGGGGVVANSNAVTSTPSSTIFVHVDVGHVFQMQLGDEMKEVVGPAMVKIVNNDSTQPVPLQLTAPAPGQYVQQLLDENGMLQHIIISSNPPPTALMAPPSITSQPVLAQQQQGPVKPQATTGLSTTNNNIPANAALIPPSYTGPHLIPYQQHITQTPSNNTLPHHYNNSNNKTSTTNNINKPTYLHHNGKANKLHPSYSPNPYGITYPVSSNNTAITSNNNNSSSTSNNNNTSTNSYALNPANNTTTLPVISSTPNYHHIHHQYHQYNQYNNNKSQAYLLSNNNNSSNNQQQTPSPPSQSPLPLLITGGQHFVNHHIDESIVNQHHNIHQHHHHQAVNNSNNLSSSIDNAPGESLNSERFIGQTTTTNNNTPSVTSNSVSPLSSSSCSSTSIGNGRVASEHFTTNSQNSNSRFRKPNQQQQASSAYLIRPPSTNNNSSLKSLRPGSHKTYNKAQYLNSPTAIPPTANRVLNHKLYKQQKFPVMMVNNNQQTGVHLQHSSSQMSNPSSVESHMTPLSKAHEIIVKNMPTLTSLLTSRTQKPVLGEIDAREVVVFLAAIDMTDYESIISDMTTDNDNDPAEPVTNGDKQNGGEIVADEASNSSSRSNNLDEETLAELRDKFQKIVYSLELASCGSVSSLPAVETPTSNFNTVFTAEAKDTTEVTLKDLKPNTKYLLRTFAALTSTCHGEYVPYPPMAFQTKPCEPDALQQPPKLCGQKKKNELTLKWAQGPAPVDNGSKITNYILEYQEIKNPLNNSTNSSSSGSEQNEEVLSHDHFEIAYKGPLKQATVKKLQPSTCYAFRVSAENAYGRGPCSPTAFIYTAGSVPPQPEAPSLVDSSVSTLTLTWRLPNSASSVDTQYELQLLDLNDPFNYNIYLTVYNGPSNVFTVSNLRRGNSIQQPPGFQFRVRAYNEEGYSPWSEARKFSTRPDRPQAPSKLRVTRLAGANSGYKCVWEPPRDSGGAPVHTFTLEIRLDDTKDESYQQIYSGDQCEFVIDPSYLSTLRPGCSYLLRVFCANESGQSDYSTESVVFTVPAVLPGVCVSPKLNTKPKSNMAQFRWSPPIEDGGSPIIAYELRLCELDTQSVSIHKSNGDECSLTIDSLLPGRNYTAQLRAVNKLGPCRDWSDPALEFTSGAGAPDAPQAPTFVIKSPTCLQVSWHEVNGNGAPIIEYRLEWAEKPQQQTTDNQNISFVQLYSGTAVRYELRGGFQAASRYLFRLQAVNANGASSAYSPIVDFLTPAQVPAQIHHVRVEEIRTESALVVWKQPNNNGSPIQSYNIDLIENSTTSTTSLPASSGYIVVHDSSESGESEHLLENLQPDTVYRVRIQAANSVGVGQFSAVQKFRTKSYPPQAPTSIECISSTYNCIKLKWSTVGGSSSSGSASLSSSSAVSASSTDQQIVYVLEMMAKPNKKHLVKSIDDENRRDENSQETEDRQEQRELIEDVSNNEDALPFVQVYKGNMNAFKAGKLNESTEYWFRVAACNEAGIGKWSDTFKFITTTAPPSVNKAPVINEITTNSCLVEWQTAKSASIVDTTENLEYCLQVKSSNDDYREVYRGSSCSYRLTNLDANVEYYVRVCATRINTEPRLVSPFSPHTAFTTLRLPKPLHHGGVNSRQAKFGESSSSTSLADSIINTQRTKRPGGKSSLMSRLMAFLTPISMNKKINENAKPQQIIQASIQQQKSVKQSKRVSRYQDVNSHLVSSSQKSSLNASSSSTSSTSNGIIGSGGSLLGIKRESADQYWALGMIIVLLAIAFVIAYLGMQFYDLSSIIQTDVETSESMNHHHRMSEF